MKTTVVFSFIGVDKPGLVKALSNTVSNLGGNWLESRMSQLAGNFAGIARVQIDLDKAEALTQALKTISKDELAITLCNDHSQNENNHYQALMLSLIGNDRPGIVHELTSALAALKINVSEMNTKVISAPMTADLLFQATVNIQVPSQLDINDLTDRLDEIANKISIDINLEV